MVATSPTPARPAALTPADMERIEAEMLNQPQVSTGLRHHFSPGVYARECEMPAGSIVLGFEHTTQHLNVVLAGRARVLLGGEVKTIKAGDVFESAVGARKLFVVEEPLRFLTIHATEETDLAKLEDTLVRKTETFRAHELLAGLAKIQTDPAK